MRTILVRNLSADSVFHFQDPDAPNENQFLGSVVTALQGIYVDYRCIVFCGSFAYDDRRYRPDLALVATDFSHWFIIEVELVSHSFQRHVMPQVLAFRYGQPQRDCINLLAGELDIDHHRARTLIEFIPRSVAVVANRREANWQTALGAHGVQMLTVSQFRSPGGVDALEVEGALDVMAESLGFGTYSATDRSLRFPKTVRLREGMIQIYDPGGASSLWNVVRDNNAVWVTKAIGAPNIPDTSYVQLIRTVGGKLSLRRPE